MPLDKPTVTRARRRRVHQVTEGYPQLRVLSAASAYLQRTTALAVTDATQSLSASLWFRADASNANRTLVSLADIVLIRRLTSGAIQFRVKDGSGNVCFDLTTTDTDWGQDATTWHHFYGTGNRTGDVSYIFVDGLVEASGNFANYTIDWADAAASYIAAGGVATEEWAGGLGDVWIGPDSLLPGDHVLFRDATSGNPKDLGPSGITPTGTVPICFFRGPAANIHKNRGRGGDFVATAAWSDI